MTYRSSRSLLGAALLSFTMGGCGGVPAAGEGEGLGAAVEADESDNGLTANALTINALTINALTINALTINALTINALTINSLLNTALTDPAARTVMKYVVGCALPTGKDITVEIPVGSGSFYTFSGQVGLYPSWSTSSCPADSCQPTVSACVIARINAAGHAVPLSVRGDGMSADSTEQSLYPTADGVFFGNVFAQPQIRDACLPDGVALTRTCGVGVDPSSCGAVHYLGACSSVCDTHAADGSWRDCWDTAAPHTGGTAYPESVSVFLQLGQIVP